MSLQKLVNISLLSRIKAIEKVLIDHGGEEIREKLNLYRLEILDKEKFHRELDKELDK